ncbi:MAG: NahK/ErcS family hybrid sensor histidine kinase/response regulator [Rhodospirillales bacterium]
MADPPSLDISSFNRAKLQKIVNVLMDQVERGIDFQGNAYSLFQTAILLEDKVRERTRRLEMALHDLERSNRELILAKSQTETVQTRLMDAVESISEGFVHFDCDDRLVLCNTKFVEFWSGAADIREVMRPGVPFREISRWTVENGLVNVEGDADDWLRDRLHRHRNPSDPVIVHLSSGRWLQIRERRTRSRDIVGIYTDITDIKLGEERRRERELAEKSVLLQSTLDTLAQGVSVFDRDSRLVAWNDRFVDLLALPGWLVRPGAGFADYLRYRIDRGDFGIEAPAAMATQQERIRCRQAWKSEQILANGAILEVRRDPMPDGGFVTTYTDVTDLKVATRQLHDAKEWLERRVVERTAELTAVNDKLREEIYERAQVEDALQIAKAEAESANLSKTRFLAGASHDLLQPLNAARLFITALTECSLGGKEREFAGQIEQALCNVETLLSTLLDISKLDAGAVIPKCSDFVVGDLLRGLVEEFAPVAADAGLELIFVPCSAAVRSDPVLLSRVIRNFLANAIRYTAAGRVLLGCRRREKVVRIEICDTGIGIPESATQQVFEEFRQLSTRGEARGKGVGLGLAIVKRLSRILGHPIGVRSKIGKGSAFFVDVPVGSLPDAHERIQTVRRTPVHALASALIVIIEDHDAVRDGMRELLQSWGCRAITAVDGQRALVELAQAGPAPDVVIADYHLDRGDTGLAAVAAVRAAHGPVPALIITADRSREVMDAVRHQGIHALHKPVKPAKLRALISHLLAQRRHARADAEAKGRGLLHQPPV